MYEVWNDKLDGRTNKWLCDKTGILPSEMSQILNGKLNPTKEQIASIEGVMANIKVYQP